MYTVKPRYNGLQGTAKKVLITGVCYIKNPVIVDFSNLAKEVHYIGVSGNDSLAQ